MKWTSGWREGRRENVLRSPTDRAQASRFQHRHACVFALPDHVEHLAQAIVVKAFKRDAMKRGSPPQPGAPARRPQARSGGVGGPVALFGDRQRWRFRVGHTIPIQSGDWGGLRYSLAPHGAMRATLVRHVLWGIKWALLAGWAPISGHLPSHKVICARRFPSIVRQHRGAVYCGKYVFFARVLDKEPVLGETAVLT